MAGDIYSDKKVILVNGGSSNWFEQAIFIIKKNTKQLIDGETVCNTGFDLVAEAERIVAEYIRGDKGETSVTKNINYHNLTKTNSTNRKCANMSSAANRKSFDRTMYLALLFCALTLGFLMIRNYMGS